MKKKYNASFYGGLEIGYKNISTKSDIVIKNVIATKEIILIYAQILLLTLT